MTKPIRIAGAFGDKHQLFVRSPRISLGLILTSKISRQLAARLHGVKAVGAGLLVRGSEVIRAVR